MRRRVALARVTPVIAAPHPAGSGQLAAISEFRSEQDPQRGVGALRGKCERGLVPAASPLSTARLCWRCALLGLSGSVFNSAAFRQRLRRIGHRMRARTAIAPG